MSNAGTLFYLPLRARAEIPRLIASYGKVPYKNEVVPVQDWSQHEKGLVDRHYFGQMPTLVLPDGKSICQSGAISRYLAKLSSPSLYPTDIIAAAEADMIYELTQDMNLINPILNFYQKDSEIYHEKYREYFAALPNRLKACAKLLQDKSFFGGESPHFGDLALFHICQSTLHVQPDCLEAFPTIRKWVDRCSELEGVKEYLASRPTSPNVGVPGSFINQN